MHSKAVRSHLNLLHETNNKKEKKWNKKKKNENKYAHRKLSCVQQAKINHLPSFPNIATMTWATTTTPV